MVNRNSQKFLKESFTKVIINLRRTLYCYNRNRKCYEFTPINQSERRRIPRKTEKIKDAEQLRVYESIVY